MLKALIKSDDDPNKWFYGDHTITLIANVTWRVTNKEGEEVAANVPNLETAVRLIDIG